jgi:hypothetical protein
LLHATSGLASILVVLDATEVYRNNELSFTILSSIFYVDSNTLYLNSDYWPKEFLSV